MQSYSNSPPPVLPAPPELATASPISFLQPSLPFYTDNLAYLTHILNPLALEINKTQTQRLSEARYKRKRSQRNPQGEDAVLATKKVHTKGLNVEQIWEQSRRVLDFARREVESGLEAAEAERVADLASETREDVDEDGDGAGSLGEEGVDYEVEGADIDGDDYEGSDAAESDVEMLMNGHDDYDDVEDMDRNFEDEGTEPVDVNAVPDVFVADKFGLNDGFFSIDEFNRTSEFLEQQDTRGDDDGAASDEEDLDFDADPLAQAVNGSGPSVINENLEDPDEDADGPTFGDPDASSEDEDEGLARGEMDDMGGMSNTNNIMYADFFAPPAQKKRKGKKGRPNPHNFPPSAAINGAVEQQDEADVERTIAAVHRDLFEDEESDHASESEERAPLGSSDPRSRRSTHEKRKAALAEEIRKLEAANVAKREWTLSGEARAADRPLNSLLEEDLDFERTGKPVPVITAEVSESIEELIKRRILAHEFQDIIRRRPDDLATGRDGRRGKIDFVLEDTKSKKGLAEEYEEEHLRRTDPGFVDVKDAKLKKEEEEISALWAKISADLDSLSSWHFRPKRPAPQIEIRTDAPVIAMEDARPNVGGEVAGASQLAPQEVYRAGEGPKGVREEVVGKSGLPAGREEMSREEKKRRRRREKERISKAGGVDAMKGLSKGGAEKAKVAGELKRGRVKIIGKKGEVTDVEGKGVGGSGAAGGQVGGGRYKL